MLRSPILTRFCVLFFNDTATTEIYTLSLHDALPIRPGRHRARKGRRACCRAYRGQQGQPDRKSTRLNSRHMSISYAVFCLKKKKKIERPVLSAKQHTRLDRKI